MAKRYNNWAVVQELISDNYYKHKFVLNYIPKFSFKDLKKPDKYIYFHLKNSLFKKLGWGRNELRLIFKEILKYTDNIIFTRDIEKFHNKEDYTNEFNVVDFSSKQKNLRKS